jgi:hypothetical protein
MRIRNPDGNDTVSLKFLRPYLYLIRGFTTCRDRASDLFCNVFVQGCGTRICGSGFGSTWAHWQRSRTDHFDILLLSGPKTINTKLCSSKGRIKFTKQKNRFFMSLKTGPPPHLHKPNMSNAPQQLKLTAWRHALHQQPHSQPKQIIIKEILYSVQLGYIVLDTDPAKYTWFCRIRICI